MFLSRGDRDLGVAFQTHPGRQAFISSGSKEPRSALESRRVSLGAHWVDPFTFHFYALEKEMATHSSVLAWRLPGAGEPGGLPSMGSHTTEVT